MTINNNAEPLWFGNWNENNLNPLTRINWRASLVPAAAVIPAPIAYTKVVAVKKLVVDFLVVVFGPSFTGCVYWGSAAIFEAFSYLLYCGYGDPRHLL